MPTITPLIDHLLALDALKHVQRRNYLTPHPQTGEQRLENSAEHSWHLAMACWAVADYFDVKVNHEKLLKMALVHDVGEIDAGDTFLFDQNRSIAHINERVGVEKLANMQGASQDLLKYWDEQETGTSQETKLLKAVDRLLPFMMNMISKGGAWRDHAVKRSQIESALAFIENDFPQIHQYMTEQIDIAVKNDWLIKDNLPDHENE